MYRLAEAIGTVLPPLESLKAMYSRWENNWKAPSLFYRRLLAAALDLPIRSMGLKDDRDVPYPQGMKPLHSHRSPR
jgi:hypothetical protein